MGPLILGSWIPWTDTAHSVEFGLPEGYYWAEPHTFESDADIGSVRSSISWGQRFLNLVHWTNVYHSYRKLDGSG